MSLPVREKLKVARATIDLWGPMTGSRYLLGHLIPGKVGQWITPGQSDDGKEFDRTFGVETEETVGTDKLDIAGDSSKDAVEYIPTSVTSFHYMLKQCRVNPESSTFIDIGAGKGRVLMMASHYRFQEIVGIEASQALVDLCQKNIATFSKNNPQSPPISVLFEDATTYELPRTHLTLYLCNPFRNEVLRKFLANLESSARAHPRKIILIYDYPWEAEPILEKCSFLKLTKAFRPINADQAWNAYEVHI